MSNGMACILLLYSLLLKLPRLLSPPHRPFTFRANELLTEPPVRARGAASEAAAMLGAPSFAVAAARLAASERPNMVLLRVAGRPPESDLAAAPTATAGACRERATGTRLMFCSRTLPDRRHFPEFDVTRWRMRTELMDLPAPQHASQDAKTLCVHAANVLPPPQRPHAAAPTE